jgi:hypothetical protein
MGHQQDRIWNISAAPPIAADTLGNLDGCIADRAIVVIIGGRRRMMRWIAAWNQPDRTVTSRMDCFLFGRLRHVACSILLLLFGPGCEALMIAGLFDSAAEWLARAIARASLALAPAPASSLDHCSAVTARCGFQLIHSSKVGC